MKLALKLILTIATALLAMLIPAQTFAVSAPSTVNYQAVLTTGGAPLTTPVQVTFTIYDADLGGNAVWTETRTVTPDALGRVSVRLGETNAMDAAVFSGPNRWLGVQVGADPEMTPRMAVSSSSYALRTATIDGATGGNLEGDLVLHEAATKDYWASSAQVILVNLDGDSTIIDPSKLRMVDNLGVEQVTVSTDPVSGPVLGIRDPGGQVADHTAAASSYYKNSSLLKSPEALRKTLEVTADGVWIFDEASGDTVGSLKQTAEGPVLTMTSTAVVKDATAVSATVQYGPPDTVFRLKDGAGNVLMQGTLVPTEMRSMLEFFTPSTVTKAAGYKSAELSDRGMVLFDAGGAPLVKADAQSGYLSGYRGVFGRNNNITIAATKAADGTMMNPDPGLVAGDNNTLIGANASAIGDWNTVGGSNSIALGYNNTVNGLNSLVGGFDNFSAGNQVTMIGDSNYVAFGQAQIVCFGEMDSVMNSAWGSVLGGHRNTLYNSPEAVVAGKGNWLGLANVSSVLGGQYNIVKGSMMSVISGGQGNRISIDDNGGATFNEAAIGGGNGNIASNSNATIGGGYLNTASGGQSTISGGNTNTASGHQSVVGGGIVNAAGPGNGTTVAGGEHNTASGNWSTVPGGYGNIASGVKSFAAGYEANAAHNGAFVWADDTGGPPFTSTAINQFLIKAGGGVGINTNAPQSALHVNGAISTKMVGANANYAMGDEAIVIASAPVVGMTVTLPNAANCAGRQVTVKKIDNVGTVTVVSAGGAIDGAVNYLLGLQYSFVTLVSDGSNWFIVAR